MKGLWLAGLLLAAGLAASHADKVDSLLADVLASLGPRAEAPLVVGIGTLQYADKKLGSPFSRYLEEKLELALARNPRFELVQRDQLARILEEIELGLSDLVDPRYPVSAGKLKGVQAILAGRFFDYGTEVQVFLELTRVETGTLLGKREVLLPKAAVPASIGIVPDNYGDALQVLEELGEIENADNREFRIKVWTTRGDGGTYRLGEDLVVHFFANKDCFLKIYHVGAGRTLSLIFPNAYQQDNFVLQRRVYKIPDERYPFRFTLAMPTGTEFIKVLASTVQFKDIEEAFQSLGTPSGKLIQRGLVVQHRKEQISEAMISYTIVP